MSPKMLLKKKADRYGDGPACQFEGRFAASAEIHRRLDGFSSALSKRASESVSGTVLKRQLRGRLGSPGFEADGHARTYRPSQ
jgi:hypothetical protein